MDTGDARGPFGGAEKGGPAHGRGVEGTAGRRSPEFGMITKCT
jgi:hypothetical protein